MSRNVSRRSILAGTGPAALIAAAPAGRLTGQTHPDAALLAAWEEYKAGWHTIGTQEHDAGYIRLDAAQALLEAIPARTPAGLSIKLRLLFAGVAGTASAENTIMYGAPLDEGDSADWRDRMLWKLVGEAEAMEAHHA